MALNIQVCDPVPRPLDREELYFERPRALRKKPRILIVDNEPSFTRLLRLMLERTGRYEVREENKGKRAIESAKEFGPDLVLLDIIMPDMAGSEIAAEFRKQPQLRKIPIVFVTSAFSTDDSGVLPTAIEGHCLVPKSACGEELIGVIERHLGR